MRFYDIALFIFIVNLVLGFLQVAVGSYTSASIGSAEGFSSTDVQVGEERISEQVSDTYTPIWSELNWLVENVRLVIQGLGVFMLTFGKATILFPLLWYEIGAPYVGNSGTWLAFVSVLSSVFYFIYLVAIVQWSTGRSAKNAQ